MSHCSALKEVDRERTLQENEKQHGSLRRERDELQDTLNQTENVKLELRAQIRVLEAERAKLQRELDAAEEKVIICHLVILHFLKIVFVFIVFTGLNFTININYSVVVPNFS